MNFLDIVRLCKKFFDESAYVYIRRKLGNKIRHVNGKINFYSDEDPEITFQDDFYPNPIKIKKTDIVFIDYSKERRRL